MEYIESRNGGVFVAGSRISLASIIHHFAAGASPEAIQSDFPTLSLAQIHGAIA